jgi:outer membrane murein-binding lipoprotein Lpp
VAFLSTVLTTLCLKGAVAMSKDTEPKIARDAGPLNVREAKAALDYHAARAQKRGDYGCYTELKAVGDVIDQLVEKVEELNSAGGQLVRLVMAAKESLTRLP